MTITATTVLSTPTYKSWTITCADADTTGSFAHGFGAIPDAMLLSPVFGQGTTTPGWGISATSTTITLVKVNAASTGGTTPGTTIVLKVVALLPISSL